MMKIYTLLLSLMLTTAAYGQGTVIWAAEVLDVSSEFGPLEYSALQALHKPNVLPGGGQNPNSWRPKKPDKVEFITVAFDDPIVAKQVAIAESENPGAVAAVYAYDVDYNEYLLFELTPTELPIESRLLNLFFEETSYAIKALRIELSGDLVPGHNAIDAVGVSASNIPISVLIKIARGINQEIPSERLSEEVNSPYIDHGPIISPDGKRLYFSRQFHPENTGGVDDQEDIWVSEFDEEKGEWQPAKNVGPPLNNEGPNFISSIVMVDGEEVLILGNRYGKKGRMSVGVSTSTYTDGNYTSPESFEITNDYNYDRRADFFLTDGGRVLLISAERDETHGLRDLYVAFREKDSWTEPKNMGSVLNTIAMESAPFFAQDGKTLYFSSAGHTGYGGLDIYVSRRLDDTWMSWSEPENLGPAINTELDDEYFSIPSTGRHLYFTRGDVNENTDIFRFEANDFLVSDDSPLYSSIGHLVDEALTPSMVVIRGNVRNAKTGELLGQTSVKVLRLPDGAQLGGVQTDDSANFDFSLTAGLRYALNAEKEGYLAQSERLDLTGDDPEDTLVVDLLLQPVEVGRSITLNNIFFGFDNAGLTTSSYPELDRIVSFLGEEPVRRIRVAGYTDATGDERYNLGLSERRAQSVTNYLIANGISAERIDVVGFGEENPLASNATKEGRRQNRRVEFLILEIN